MECFRSFDLQKIALHFNEDISGRDDEREIMTSMDSPQLASSEPSAQSGSSSHTHSLEMQCIVVLH